MDANIIYKYVLDRTNVHNIITAPIVKPLHVDIQRGDPCLWAVVDITKEPEEWVVSCIGTGWSLDKVDSNITTDHYLNTTVASSDPFVWHWFCRKYVQSADL